MTTPIERASRGSGPEYITDGAEIYKRSFATIRAEADLSKIPADVEKVIVRMIHACGMVDLVDDVEFSADFGQAGRRALAAGAPILTDSNMVAYGVTRSRLPADNPVICRISDPGLAQRAAAASTTRAAIAVDDWRPDLSGAVVAIGNAPTALFRLLEILEQPGPRPAAIIGIPVGFVGAAESKTALATSARGVPWITVHGRRGGSAMAAAALNALASTKE